MEDNEEYKTENELSSELTGLNKGVREKKKKLLIIIGLATVTVLLITIIIIIIIVSTKIIILIMKMTIIMKIWKALQKLNVFMIFKI